jgi:hypothetical protein
MILMVYKKYKIAICISGRIGSPIGKWVLESENVDFENITLKLCYMHWKKYVLDCNDDCQIDFFIHSWSKQLRKKIVKLFKPKQYLIEKQIYKFKDVKTYPSHNFGYLSRLYSNYAVGRQLENYVNNNDIKYDQVILSRFDQAFRTEIILNKLIENGIEDVKVFSGFYKKKSGTLKKKKRVYEPKLLTSFNDYINHTSHFFSSNLSIKIIDSFISSNYTNALLITQIFDYLKGQPIRYNLSPHVIYPNFIQLAIVGKQKGILQILDEYYFDNGTPGEMYEIDSNVPIIRQLYFNNPGCKAGKIGEMIGEPYGRLVDIKKYLKNKKVPNEIIDAI